MMQPCVLEDSSSVLPARSSVCRVCVCRTSASLA
jgi:hypothetical protein